jgi:hypothetical protein
MMRRRSWAEALDDWYQNLSPIERHLLELERQEMDREVRAEFRFRAKLVLAIVLLNLLAWLLSRWFPGAALF